jgi:acetyl-CoA C-acetyltransferase
MPEPVFVLGGYQTDFARNWSKENKHISAMFNEVVQGALESTGIPPQDVEVGHVGNFAAELYTMQGHLGAFLIETDPAFSGLPTGRHEAACASGSIALLAASAEIEAGRYDLAMVVGVEQMKTVDSARGGDFLGTAAWYEREAGTSPSPSRSSSAASATSTRSATARTSTSPASRPSTTPRC